MTATLLAAVAVACSAGGDVLSGMSCDRDGQCETGLCVTQYENRVDVAGGLCTEECEWLDEDGETCEADCAEDADTCPEGFSCLQYVKTGEKFCYEDCTQDADCRQDDGWACYWLTDSCIPPL